MSTFNGAVVEKIDGQAVEFPRLLLPDYETVQNAVASEMAARVRKMADECKLSGADRFVAMRDNTPTFPTFDLVEAYMATKAGVHLVLRKSLEKGGVQEEAVKELVGKISFPMGRDIALRVLCFRNDPPPEQTAEAGGEATVSPAAT